MDTFLFLIHGIQSHSLLDCSVTMATTAMQLHPRQPEDTGHYTNLRY
jgi:hypothetical protein